MKKFKLITMCLVPFLVFVGCGQSFQASSISVQEAENSVDANNIQVPAGDTPKSVDQRILDTYMSEFNSLDIQNIEDLISDIRSFEVQVDRNRNQVHGVSVRMHGRTNAVNAQGSSVTSCNNLISARNTHVTLTQLQSGDPVFLRGSGYEFEIQCTDSDCDEMVAAIRRTSHPEGLALIGLKAGATTSGRSGAYSTKYVARSVNIESYFTVAVNADEYISIVCSLEDEEATPNTSSRPRQPSRPPVSGEPSQNDIEPVNPIDELVEFFNN